jgi:2-keto-3-deoxy-L-rhamnonate aldolase RhmA
MTASDSQATRPNPFREAMRQGRPLVGIWSMLNSVDATEALGWSGYDWLLIDGEHAPVSLHDAMAHCRAIAATPTIPIVAAALERPATDQAASRRRKSPR